MDYQILDDLWAQSENNKEQYFAGNGKIYISAIEKLNESFQGSSDTINTYIFKNFISSSGAIDLLVVIREIATNQKLNGFAIKNVEQAVYPLYITKSDKSIEIPIETISVPFIAPEHQEFIIAKRALPKKPYDASIAFDENKHKWPCGLIAERLHISNRTVGKFCRAHGI